MSEFEKTLAIVKPDGVKRGLIGRIVMTAEEHGLRVVEMKSVHFTVKQAEAFYAIHKGKPFFEPLIEFMTSSMCVMMILGGYDAINWWRKLIGDTNPADARRGTIRRDYCVPGAPIRENVVHGSDSIANARREIEFYYRVYPK